MGLILITALLVAQAGNFDPDKTYQVVLKDGSEVFGTVVKKIDKLEVTPDTPWMSSNTVHVLERNLDYTREEAADARNERRILKAGEAGFVAVGERWLPKVEVELAQRASELAAEVRKASAPPATDTTTSSRPVAVASLDAPVAPGILAQWGFHVAIIMVAAILIGLVVRFAILA